MQTISADEFYQKSKKDQLNIIDVREADEFASGHIPNAINMPLSSLARHINDLDTNVHYYFICASGSRSNMAATALSKNGFNITNVLGGMSAWKGEVV
ncbi:rhodanese-like domain-containing protein [Fundicoccus culcitae]|uniref:Rhodanese-like domain-containing protein n=1 Tax=Fundicoccus culcitae TaxID=2969821 RepID=A0ABY5P6X3_9LACT|nr:rhodanese-like domain-containing protein [Fundicoccus culcitae]UUX34487.1 rhodanese-like domain-containing protein [Fundicoccus culcitae]